MLRNGNFMEGWETLDPLPEANFLRNQRPRGWQLAWLKPGTPLYDDPNTQATGIPECVHKLSTQLPPDEQRGQPKALILDGDTTYKIFSATAPFGATLSQTVTGLEPGSQATLTGAYPDPSARRSRCARCGIRRLGQWRRWLGEWGHYGRPEMA
jgi:hypothetical protein